MGRHNHGGLPQSEPTLVRRAEITKQELAVVSAQYGAGNMAAFEGYEPNTLRLETFTGEWDAKQRKFIGQYSFLPGGSWVKGEVDRICDFNKLAGIALQRSKKATTPTPPTPPTTPVAAPQAIAGGNVEAESEVKHVVDV